MKIIRNLAIIMSVISIIYPMTAMATENAEESSTETVTETVSEYSPEQETATENRTDILSSISAETFWNTSKTEAEKETENIPETEASPKADEIMVIPDGTVKGKLIVLSWLGIGAIYFFLREKICEKKMQKLMPEEKNETKCSSEEKESEKNRRRYYAKMRKISKY